MSDNLLLSMLWAVPLAGSLLVLLIPGRNDLAVKFTGLGVSLATFALSIVAFVAFLGLDPTSPSTDLAFRAQQNTLAETRWARRPSRRRRPATSSIGGSGSRTSTSSTSSGSTASA